MSTTIEYSCISRSYWVRLPDRTVGPITRKDDAERTARELGATEIEHHTRTARSQLLQLGFDRESAKTIGKEFFPDRRRR